MNVECMEIMGKYHAHIPGTREMIPNPGAWDDGENPQVHTGEATGIIPKPKGAQEGDGDNP